MASKVWQSTHESARKFREECLMGFAWLAKQVSAGALYPSCKLYKKKIPNCQAAITVIPGTK